MTTITTEALVAAYADQPSYIAWASDLFARFQSAVAALTPNGEPSPVTFVAIDVADFLLRAAEDFPYNDPAEDDRFAKYLSIAAAAVTDPRGAGAVLTEAAA
jgi:hypothetical protein